MRRFANLRRLLLGLGLLILLGAAILYRDIPVGWWHGEAFWRGRPTHYWADYIGEALRWRERNGDRPPPWYAKLWQAIHFGPPPMPFSSDPEAALVQQELLESPAVEENVRAFAAQVLGQRSDAKATIVPVLARALDDPSLAVRRGAAFALWQLEAEVPRATRVILQTLDDPSQRALVCFYLQNYSPMDGGPVYEQARQHADSRIRAAAVSGLQRLRKR